MNSELKFKVGHTYLDRAGRKYECIRIKRNGNVVVIDLIWEIVSERKPSGRIFNEPGASDLISECQEPRKWDVFIVEWHGRAVPRLRENVGDKCEVLARVTMTEGEGLDQ